MFYVKPLNCLFVPFMYPKYKTLRTYRIAFHIRLRPSVICVITSESDYSLILLRCRYVCHEISWISNVEVYFERMTQTALCVHRRASSGERSLLEWPTGSIDSTSEEKRMTSATDSLIYLLMRFIYRVTQFTCTKPLLGPSHCLRSSCSVIGWQWRVVRRIES